MGMLEAPNGAYLRSFYLARELSKRGHHVTLLTNQRNTYKFPIKVSKKGNLLIVATFSFAPLRIRKFGYGLLPLLIRIVYVLFHKYEIVHADNHRPVSSLPCFVHRIIHRSKFIMEWYDFFGKTGQYENKNRLWKATIGIIDNFLELFMNRSADGCIVLSELLKKRALHLRKNISNIEIIWGGSDTKSIPFFSSSKIYRNKFNIPKDKIVFMSTGIAPSEIYEYDEFFSFFHRLAKKYNNILFIRTGKSISDDAKKRLKLENNYYEIGFTEYKDYGQLLSCADFFVHIQKNNNKNKGRWPNCVGDYIAAGRPIIYNEVGDLAKLKSLNEVGFINIPLNKSKKFSTNLEERIFNNINNKNIFYSIRDFSEKNFTWNKRSTELEQFYKNVLNN